MGIISKHHYNENENYLAELFRCFAHPCRIRIITTLLVHDSRTVGELTAQFGGPAQSCISDQLSILKEGNLIIGTQIGTSIRYRLNHALWEEVKVLFHGMSDEQLVLLLPRYVNGSH